MRSQHTVLVVDDEEGVREMLVDSLRAESYLCHGAANGMEALEILSRTSIDLALVDILMPGLTGQELFQRMRVEHPDVAVVFLTAITDLELAVKNLKEGAFDYIPKPAPNKWLLEKVREALARRQQRLEQRIRQKETEERAAEQSLLLEARMREVRALNQFMQDRLNERVLLQETSRRIATVALQAAETIRALAAEALDADQPEGRGGMGDESPSGPPGEPPPPDSGRRGQSA